MASGGSNSDLMPLNCPQFQLGSLDEKLFCIGYTEQTHNSLRKHSLEKTA
jgi:hypothetical protein